MHHPSGAGMHLFFLIFPPSKSMSFLRDVVSKPRGVIYKALCTSFPELAQRGLLASIPPCWPSSVILAIQDFLGCWGAFPFFFWPLFVRCTLFWGHSFGVGGICISGSVQHSGPVHSMGGVQGQAAKM